MHKVTDVINEIGHDTVLYSASFPDHSRNKFHFSEVHGCMNATGQVQSMLLCTETVAFILP